MGLSAFFLMPPGLLPNHLLYDDNDEPKTLPHANALIRLISAESVNRISGERRYLLLLLFGCRFL